MNIFKRLLFPPQAPRGLHVVATEKAVSIYNNGVIISLTPDLAESLAAKLRDMASLSRRMSEQE